MPRLNRCLLTVLIFLFTPSLYALEGDQPNIVLLLADDLGYGELGCQGNPQIGTPWIDSIAAQGVRFTQGYVTGPNCSPSRAGLLTGKIPTRFGYEFNPIGPRNEEPGIGLPASELTLAEALHAAGYTTGIIGKWHLGGSAAYHPLRRGFDEFFGFTHEGHYFLPPPWSGATTMLRRQALPGNQQGRWLGNKLVYSTHMGHDEPDYDANNPIVRGGQPVFEPEYLTDALARESVDFIERHSDKPFFLYVAFNAVHSPLQGADSYMERYAHIEDIHRRIFAAMLANLDDAVGRILRKIEQQQLASKTLVIFLSDNGGPTRELTSSNLPLRGFKGQMYEGALRVPMMMKWPGKLPAATVETRPVWSPDLYATALILAGTHANGPVDGVNLMPYITGEIQDRPHLEFFWRQGDRTAIRSHDWKLIGTGPPNKRTWELYDLSTDLAEQHDLAPTRPALTQEIFRRWEIYNTEMSPPLFR